MRIKRQRRKLRGKYSGNCLSCTAKWSKCWYIASTDNQREWEARLQTLVTPGDDEVCFQCWDAKIRTSPKRKVQFKAVAESNDLDLPNVGNKRRKTMLSEFGLGSSAITSTERYDTAVGGSESDGEAGLYEGSIILEEEAAVILLSTAFRTIPHHFDGAVNIDINITSYDTTDLEGAADDKFSKRGVGAYCCSKGGRLKRGHICDIPSPEVKLNSPVISLPIQSINIQVSPTHSLPTSISSDALPVAFAQPVVS